jgi:hypothetical protein
VEGRAKFQGDHVGVVWGNVTQEQVFQCHVPYVRVHNTLTFSMAVIQPV